MVGPSNCENKDNRITVIVRQMKFSSLINSVVYIVNERQNKQRAKDCRLYLNSHSSFKGKTKLVPLEMVPGGSPGSGNVKLNPAAFPEKLELFSKER